MNKLDFNEFEESLGKWAPLLKPWFESEDAFKIYKTLKEQGQSEVIVPDPDNTFRAFKITDPKRVKNIWYLMDPYPRYYRGTKIPQATGIAMDCSNSPDGKIQPSLVKFYDAMDKEFGKPVLRSPDLSYLHEQGVMLLNTDFTCKLDKTGSHEKLWDSFQKFFLGEVMGKMSGIVYVLSGEISKRMERYIYPIGNYIIKVEHPAAADKTGRDWQHNDIFGKINNLLGEKYIFWDKRDWDMEVPF